MNVKIYVYLFDGYSDWEIAYLSPEIKKNGNFDLIYISNNGDIVESMGGLRVIPHKSLAEIRADDIDILILPGGSAWEQGGNTEIDSLVKELFDQQKIIASICAATTYIARHGFLDNVKHTSNDLYYLKGIAPNYRGDNHYLNEQAVSDQHIITANGISPIEFAREIFKAVKLYPEADIEKWFNLFKHGIWAG